MAFKFSAGKSTTPKKFSGREVDPVVFKTDHAKQDLVFITETVHRDWLRYLNLSMAKRFPDVGYKIIQVFPFTVSEEEIKKGGATKFYFKHCPDMRKLIEPGQQVIPIGRAMMSVTLDPDVTTDAFYDTQFQKSYFYAPELMCNVFPVDPTFKWYDRYDKRSLDNFYRHFMWEQVDRALEKPSTPSRIRKPVKIMVENHEAFYNAHMEEPEVAWDLETNSLDFLTGKVICITMSFDGKTGYYLRFRDIESMEKFDNFMKGKYQIGANLKFDIKFMKYYYPFKNLRVDFDTMQAGHVLNEMRSNSLKTHAWMYTNYGGYDLELERYKLKYPKLKSYADIPEPVLFNYAVMDAIVTFEIYQRMKEAFSREPELERYFYEDVMPVVSLFPDIELTGVQVDWDMVKEVGDEFTAMATEIEKQMVPIFGNIHFGGDDLPRKLEELGWPSMGLTKKGLYKTNKVCMAEWAELKMEGVELLQQRTKLLTARNMFVGVEEDVSGFWKFKGPDGKLHPNYAIMMALSHRFKCRNPNLQQFPKHSREGKMVRKCFVGLTEMFGISESDYDGLQLRIGQILSKDPVMEDIFNNQGGDMHSITGHSVFFSVPKNFVTVVNEDGSSEDILETEYDYYKEDNKYQSVSETFKRLLTLKEFLSKKNISTLIKDARRKAKFCNFGMLFGSTVHGVCYNIVMPNWKPEECIEFIKDNGLNMPLYNESNPKENFEELALVVARFIHEAFFGTYRRLTPWIEECHTEAKRNGYIRCVHGARRLFPQFLYVGADTDKKEISSMENISVNSRVQNFEVVVVGRAMVKIAHGLIEAGLQSTVFGMIHDAIELYVHKDETAEVYKIIKDSMEIHYPEYGNIELTAESDLAWPNHPEKDKKTYWGSSPIWNGETFEELFVS